MYGLNQQFKVICSRNRLSDEHIGYHDGGTSAFPQVSSSNHKILLSRGGLRNSEVFITHYNFPIPYDTKWQGWPARRASGAALYEATLARAVSLLIKTNVR